MIYFNWQFLSKKLLCRKFGGKFFRKFKKEINVQGIREKTFFSRKFRQEQISPVDDWDGDGDSKWSGWSRVSQSPKRGRERPQGMAGSQQVTETELCRLKAESLNYFWCCYGINPLWCGDTFYSFC